MCFIIKQQQVYGRMIDRNKRCEVTYLKSSGSFATGEEKNLYMVPAQLSEKLTRSLPALQCMCLLVLLCHVRMHIYGKCPSICICHHHCGCPITLHHVTFLKNTRFFFMAPLLNIEHFEPQTVFNLLFYHQKKGCSGCGNFQHFPSK